MIWQAKEWETPVSGWHCGCVDDLAHDSNAWYIPARILGISPAEFIKLLVTEYKPDHIHFLDENGNCFFSYSWDSQAAMRRFKNNLNKIAREKNFQI